MMPDSFGSCIEQLKEFTIFDDDLFLVSFPRSGSDVMKELVWLLQNNLDYDTASKISVKDRVKYFE